MDRSHQCALTPWASEWWTRLPLESLIPYPTWIASRQYRIPGDSPLTAPPNTCVPGPYEQGGTRFSVERRPR